MPSKPLPFRIPIRNTQSGQSELCSGVIASDDWQRMDAFRKEAARLREADWVRTGLNVRYQVRPEAGRTVIDWPERPTDTAIADLLHRLRPFVLQGESLYFPRVTGRMWGYFTHPAIRDMLAQHRAGFENGYGRAYYEVSISHTRDDALNNRGFVLNDARAFDLWVNSFEYHRDTAKRDELLRLLGDHLDDWTRTTFVHLAADKARAVLHVAHFLDDLAARATARVSGSPGVD